MPQTSQEIRKAFLDFFAGKEHHIVSSAPMVIKNDPTLMFTNAGMNQFKDIFLGNTPRKYPRAADTQKCLRVSGKHNDLEEVGHDTYHHTMFEMLGNWSFGDYFKKEAIAWAWEFLTEVMKLDKNRLYVTVFGGDEKDGTALDTEAREFWKEHISEDRILLGNKHDNFWEMGDTGPCGPCSEIHVDIRDDEERAKIDGKELVNKDNPQVIEIWNLVFMQYSRMADGHLEELPAKCIDTGMGFERLCMVVQGKKSNYDTDVFTPLIEHLAKASGFKYGEDPKKDIAMRVVADHSRAISFAIADGQLPSNNKAGYVIRRILRRALRYGYSFLGFKEPFIYKLVAVLVDQMGGQFPEIKAQQALIEKVITEEENAFLRTIETGTRLLGQLCEKLKAEHKDTLSGVDAFTLYDTYGFPLDLTELMLREEGFKVDQKGFDAEMAKQKERARADAAVTTDDWVVLIDSKDSEFVGYDKTECETRLQRYRKVNRKGKDFYQLIFSPTPFYAEMGGQTGDSGYIEDLETGEKTAIIDTVKENNTAVHWTTEVPARPGHAFRAVINTEKRAQTAGNHTATHLMHYALRQVLGTHVEQKGSLVNPDELRFDFSHFQKMTREEIREVERRVNALIRADIALDEHREMPVEEAKKMGAMALFSEKYGDKVRVVRYGGSVELCGGTHVAATGQIGSFRILSEGAIAAGIRRITAVTGNGAEEYHYEVTDQIAEIKELLKANGNLAEAVKKMLDGQTKMRKEMEAMVNERIASLRTELLSAKQVVNGVPVVLCRKDFAPDTAKNLAQSFRKDLPDGVAIIAGVADGRPYVNLFFGDEYVKAGHHAGNIIKEIAPIMEARGGGQPGFATCSGTKADALDTAVNKVMELL